MPREVWAKLKNETKLVFSLKNILVYEYYHMNMAHISWYYRLMADQSSVLTNIDGLGLKKHTTLHNMYKSMSLL